MHKKKEQQLYNDIFHKISFYKYHPEYIPFVGDQFSQYRILQVGESHYIPQLKTEPDIFPISYFEKWWTDNCSELKSFTNHNSEGYKWQGWLNTQSVITNYLSGNRTPSHGIFTELVKVFSQVYHNQTISHITTELSQNYQYFAFMNFFQMPAIYKGEKFWNSLLYGASQLGLSQKDTKTYAGQMWDNAAEESSKVFDQVVDILQPNIIIFTSLSAWGAYQGKHKDAPNIITTVHPGCRYWNAPKEWQIGKKQLIEKWTAIQENKAYSVQPE